MPSGRSPKTRQAASVSVSVYLPKILTLTASQVNTSTTLPTGNSQNHRPIPLTLPSSLTRISTKVWAASIPLPGKWKKTVANQGSVSGNLLGTLVIPKLQPNSQLMPSGSSLPRDSLLGTTSDSLTEPLSSTSTRIQLLPLTLNGLVLTSPSLVPSPL